MDSPPEKASLEIVEAIEARNPMVITSHHFTYEGKTYDAVTKGCGQRGRLAGGQPDHLS